MRGDVLVRWPDPFEPGFLEADVDTLRALIEQAEEELEDAPDEEHEAAAGVVLYWQTLLLNVELELLARMPRARALEFLMTEEDD